MSIRFSHNVLVLIASFSSSSFIKGDCTVLIIAFDNGILRATDFVAFAVTAGASPVRVIIKHILPGILNTVLVIASLNVGQLILTEASLSFLGVGIPKPTPAWGSMVAEGRDYIATSYWMALFPGLAIFAVV